ncbi:MAG TPA: hypothetical protein VIL74_17300 [Pyrinomonadaceae bacterium]|jgi:hypothetical protein
MKKSVLLLFLCAFFCLNAAAQRRTENVILITLDGARGREIFGGMDTELFKKIDADAENKEVFKTFAAPTPEARREILMPFFWQVWMKNHGSIAGNRALGSEARTTNNLFFSYPGYSEILTGEARDDVIKSNAFVQNRFPSVLQFLQKKLRLDSNRVAAFASWRVMNAIAASEPDAFLINAGHEIYANADRETERLSAAQFETLLPSEAVRHDYYTFRLALAHLKKHRPRVLQISFGETDSWAHSRRYDMVLKALRRTDDYFKELWRFLETDGQYRGKTTILVTVDHGRGAGADDWNNHNASIAEARYIWAAFISPDTSLRGEWKAAPPVYQNQIAATLSKYLGFDYLEQNPNAGRPIEALFAK